MKHCAQYGQYAPRLETDIFFTLTNNRFSYTGIVDKMISFIQDFQLTNKKMWDYFTGEYSSRVDYKNNGWRGEYWGKTMRGGCMVYQYTRNEELYNCLENAMYALLETADELGRISTYIPEQEFKGWDMWCRKYVLLGALHFIDICKDDTLKEKIITAMKKHLDYIIFNIGKDKKDICTTSNFWGGANSCSILEPVMRFYNITKEQRYLDFATYIVENFIYEGVNIFDIAEEGKLLPHQYPIVKAYEMMSCFEGALEYYRVTKNEKYLRGAINYGKGIIESDVTVIGCCGCTHELFDNSRKNQTLTTYKGIMQETCVTVTWIKFCTHLLSLTGESIFADEIEKSVYNALYGSVNTLKRPENGGLPFDSYSPLMKNTRANGIGGFQIVGGFYFYGCCACIGSAGLGIVPSISIMGSREGFVQNLFVPGKAELKTPLGKNIFVNINTCYPSESRVEMTFLLDTPEKFDYALRIPGYSKTTFVTLNGENIPVVTEKGYLHINRTWSKGDTVTLFFDFSLNLIQPLENEEDENAKNHIAFSIGPLVLARDKRISPDVGEKISFDEKSLSVQRGNFAEFDTLCQYKLYLGNEKSINLIDYQSAGKTWNDESEMECWIPTLTKENILPE